MIVKALAAGAIGLALGVAASGSILADPPFGAVTIGPWRVFAKAGSLEADPYTRAALARSGEIPLALGEGLKLVARVDSAGRLLDRRCLYRVGTRTPAARYWTLSLIDADGFPVEDAAGRYGFRSSETPARRRRRLFRLCFGARPFRQLAADRPRPGVRAGAASLRYAAGRKRRRHREVERADDRTGRLRMSWNARLGGAALFVAAVAAAAALVHFAVVLFVPIVATHDAYARLVELGPTGATAPLPRAGPGERRFPWDDPALATSFCRYDLSAGPLRVKAPVGRAGFASLSFHTRRDAVFYALTDRAATHGRMEAVIVTPGSAARARRPRRRGQSFAGSSRRFADGRGIRGHARVQRAAKPLWGGGRTGSEDGVRDRAADALRGGPQIDDCGHWRRFRRCSGRDKTSIRERRVR